VERESVPLHLVTEEPLDRVKALAREMVQQPGFWERYGSVLALLNRDNWEELQIMIRQMGNEPAIDLRWLVNQVGLKQVIDQVGLKQVIDQVGLKQVIDQVGLKELLQTVKPAEIIAALGPEQIQELKRLLP
jgi:hypothetical protein